MSWKDNRNSSYDSYAFTYDAIGRMLNATYTDHSNNSSVKFTENVTYDYNGNISSLERYGRTGSSSYGKIDNLAYMYSDNKRCTSEQNPAHKTQGMTETNVELKRRILSARKETINNLRQ